jgi:hypothetical protein
MDYTKCRLTYSIRFRSSKEKEWTKGREVIKCWCGTLDEMKTIAHGILAGLCTIGGYKHGHCDIYEVSEYSEKLAGRVSW